MKLANPTEDQINAAVAEFVAGWRCYKEQRGEYALAVCYGASEKDPWGHWDKNKEAESRTRYTPISCADAVALGFFGRGLPKFTRSMDAVLPLLPAVIEINRLRELVDGRYTGRILWGVHTPANPVWCWDESLPLACCIALLRAKGMKVEFFP